MHRLREITKFIVGVAKEKGLEHHLFKDNSTKEFLEKNKFLSGSASKGSLH